MFFFTAKDGTLLYMGKDKYENEDLIKYGWPEDCWFHVDALSSAHVYCRLKPGQTMDDMSEDLIRDAAQLVKENSIEGCKKASVTVIYTPWANLRKDGSMAVGQVSFHADNRDTVRKYVVIEKDKETLRRLYKTKEERYPDLCKERADRDAEELRRIKAEGKARFKARQEEEEAKRKEYAAYSYDTLFKTAPSGGGASTASRGARGGGRGARGGASGRGRAGPGSHFGPDDEADLMGLGGGVKVDATEDATAAKAFEESFM